MTSSSTSHLRALSSLLLAAGTLLGLPLTTPAAAQGGASHAAPTPPEVVLVEAGADGWRGWGSDYDVVFGARGPRFYPASDSPEHVLALELEHVTRGGSSLYEAQGERAASAEPEALTYSYSLGELGREVYHLRPDGLKQDFVIERLPAGAGDLVVSLRVGGGGRITVEGESGGARLESSEGTLVRLGRLLAYDAAGRSTMGSLRSLDHADGSQRLELVLAADFVAGASLPLVLDPLIYPGFVYQAGVSGTTYAPDATYLAAYGLYVVAFERYRPGIASLVMLATTGMTDSGVALSTRQTIRSLPAPRRFTSSPTVSTVGAGDEILVSWGEEGGTSGIGVIEARHLVLDLGKWSWGVQGTTHRLVSPAASRLDSGGGPNARRALIAWDTAGVDVWCAMVESDEDGLHIRTPRQVDAGVSNDRAPSVCEGPNWAIAWERSYEQSAVMVRRWGEDELGEPVQIGSFQEREERAPCLSGGGSHKDLVYLRNGDDGLEIVSQPLLAGYGSCMDLCLDGPAYVVAVFPEWPEISGPVVARLGDESCVVCWSAAFNGLWPLYGTTLEKGAGPLCEGFFFIAETNRRPTLHLAEAPEDMRAFLLWDGKADGFPTEEVRGARIGACSH